MENHDEVFLDSVVFRNLGLIAYQWKNDVEQATQYLSKALGNYISENNQLGIIDVQLALGGIYAGEGDITNAEEQYNRAIGLGKKLGMVEIAATSTMNLGVIQMQTGRLESAEESLYEAMKLFEEMNHFQVILVHVNLAQLEKERNNILMAKMHFSNALRESEERDAKDLQPDILTELAIIAEMENKPEDQRQFNQRAVSIWREIGVPIDQWFIDTGY
jgi:Tfp pilus assembly protein PilF